MPTYQYRCTQCASELEAVQKFTDDPLAECPACKGALRKVYSAVGVVFKGTGFYATDSRGKPKDKSATAPGKSATPAESTAPKAGSGSPKAGADSPKAGADSPKTSGAQRASEPKPVGSTTTSRSAA